MKPDAKFWAIIHWHPGPYTLDLRFLESRGSLSFAVCYITLSHSTRTHFVRKHFFLELIPPTPLLLIS